MIAFLIKLVVSNPSVSLLVFGVIGALIALSRRKKPLTAPVIVEAFTAHFFLFSVGIGYLYNFVMHVFFGEFTARFIGWADSPFQTEVGFASLGMGVAGILAFRRGLSFRTAAFLPPAFFLWGAAGGHIYQIAKTGNLAPGNAGVILWTDLLLPVIGFALLYLQKKNPLRPPPPVGFRRS